MDKKKAINGVILLTLLTTVFLSSLTPKTIISTEKTTNNNLNYVSTPKTSATKVSSLRNYTASSAVKSVSISADGYYIAVRTNNNFTLYNKTTTKRMWNYTTAANTYDFIISSSGDYIIASSESPDYQLYLFTKTFSSNKIPMWNQSGSNIVSSMSISNTGQYIVAGRSHNISLFDNEYSNNKEPLWEINTTNDVNSVVISGDGKYIAVGHAENVTFIDRTQGAVIWTHNTTEDINKIGISDDGKYIVATHNFNISYFDTSQPTLLWSYNNTPNNDVSELDISGDGKHLVAHAGNDFRVIPNQMAAFFNSSITNPKTKVWKYGGSGIVVPPRISYDGKYAVVGYNINNFSLLDRTYAMNDKPLWSVYLSAEIKSVEISKIGDYIVAGCDDGKIYLYYHNVQVPSFTLGDDDDDDDKAPAIPFGNYYLIFIALGILSLIIVYKRKIFFNKN